jgi:hypothetical protein
LRLSCRYQCQEPESQHRRQASRPQKEELPQKKLAIATPQPSVHTLFLSSPLRLVFIREIRNRSLFTPPSLLHINEP